MDTVIDDGSELANNAVKRITIRAFELQMIIKFIFYDDSAEDQAKITELVYYAVIIALTKFGKMATNEGPKKFEIPLLSLSLSAHLFNCRR